MEKQGMESEDDNKLDGNAAAGTLQTIFPFEMTLARVTCAKCGATNPIGATAAYMSRMGTIVRCSSCSNVLIRIVTMKGQDLLDMQGTGVIQISGKSLILQEAETG